MPSKIQSTGVKRVDWRIARWGRQNYPVRSTSRYLRLLATDTNQILSTFSWHGLLGLLAVFTEVSRSTEFILPGPSAPFFLIYTLLSPFQPVLWGLNESLSACPQGIMIQRKRLHCSSHILYKQSTLNIQRYSKRQVPLKIRTRQRVEFYYGISSQTDRQSVRETSSRCLEGQAQPPQKCHRIVTPVKAAWKTYEKDKWGVGEKLLSEWSTKLSGSWTEQNLPCSGQKWIILGLSKRRSKTSKRAWGRFLFKAQP